MEKKVLENQQTVDYPQKGTPGWWATVLCTSTKFKTTSNLPNLPFP